MEMTAVDEIFADVKVSELSIRDKVFQYIPKTQEQKRLKNSALEAIKQGLPDFRAPLISPTIKDGKIAYIRGEKPGLGYSPEWWEKNAKEVMPSKNSRIGKDKEWDIFLVSVIIKYLIEERGMEQEEAWRAVCDDSNPLFHNEGQKPSVEPTGSWRGKIGPWCDLISYCHIVKKTGTRTYIIAGGWQYGSNNYPLSNFFIEQFPNCTNNYATGWVVIDPM